MMGVGNFLCEKLAAEALADEAPQRREHRVIFVDATL